MSNILASLMGVQPRLPGECLPPEVKVAEERPLPQATPPEECYAPQANQSAAIVKEDMPVRGSISSTCPCCRFMLYCILSLLLKSALVFLGQHNALLV